MVGRAWYFGSVGRMGGVWLGCERIGVVGCWVMGVAALGMGLSEGVNGINGVWMVAGRMYFWSHLPRPSVFGT